ncbi:phage tail tape measure protein [Sphingomonas sp.]|jgi:TP901 family phage tail tape measure protein|uniref:phage tail tape measure protein n=1 Tax=Sphingomonas sp. TaxID=28214 RepID=UPI002E12ED17|nr:phage tail tape measure protein [Sphingomonas sp.]HEV7287711.1 phage tail tape measure protein [Sphingomonas sp.]
MDRNLRIRMLLEAGDRVTRPLRDIAGGSAKAARELKATRDRLRDLDRAQANINGFRELKAGLRSTEAQMGEAQARVNALARQIAATDTPTKKLTAEFAKAKRESAALKNEHIEQSARLQQLRDRLGSAGVATGNLSSHERRLRGDIARTNEELAEQERRLRATADRAQRLGAARDQFGKGMNMATGLAAGGFSAMQTGQTMLRPITGARDDAAVHESAMTDIAQKADLSRDAARQMGDTVLEVAAKANQLPEAIRAGIDTLSGFGLDPRQALAMMQPIGRAATAYKAEIADLSAAAFAANDNLKVPVAQTGKVIDIMAAAGKRGAFEIKDMASHFPALTAASQALGQHGTAAVADLSAALQIARKGAGSSDAAATNVANLLQKINSPGTVRAFKKNFGVDLPAALKRLYSEGKTPIEAIAELASKTVGGDLSKLGYLFEDAQVQGALRPLIQNLEEYRRIRAEAGAAGGTSDADFAERMKDAAEESRQFNVEMQNLSITMGGLLLPAATQLAKKVGGYAKAFAGWARANPGFAKGLALTAAILAGLFIVLGGGAIVVAGMVMPFYALGAAAAFLNIGLLPLIGIVLAVLAAIALLAGGAYLIYKNWGAVTGFFSSLWAGIKSTVSTGLAAIGGFIMNFTPVGMFIRAFSAVLAFLRGPLPGQMMEAGRNLIQGLIRGVMNMLGALKSTIINAASSAAKWFKQKLGIQSPSRVFMGFGGYMMEGLDRGIASESQLPIRRLDRLSKEIGAAMAVGIAAPAIAATPVPDNAPGTSTRAAASSSVAAGGRASAAPVTINIYPAPGQSAKEIAEEVRRQLEDHHRKPGGGGSFADAPDWEG